MNYIKFIALSFIVFTSLIVSPVTMAMKLMGGKLTHHNIVQQLLIDEANRQNIDPALALAIAEVESNFNPRALSHAGAKGVMQIMPATAENVYGIASGQLFDAKINIRIGVSFIKKLLNRYNQRLDIALSHYNGGSAVQDKFGRLSVIPATRKYVNKVISAQHKFIDKIKRKSVNRQSNYQSVIPVTKSVVRNVLKPERKYSSESFNNSLYQKMEHLRTLRLHNIMRNTQSKSANKTPIVYRPAKPSKRNNTRDLKETAKTLSEKRKKVLSWEAMFN